MKLFKGFDRNLKCRDFQYEIGGEYRTKRAKLCKSGFHACENPIEVFNYYPPSESRYCSVEMDEISPEMDYDSKRVATKIKINEEIGISGIIEAFIEFITGKTTSIFGFAKQDRSSLYGYVESLSGCRAYDFALR